VGGTHTRTHTHDEHVADAATRRLHWRLITLIISAQTNKQS